MINRNASRASNNSFALSIKAATLLATVAMTIASLTAPAHAQNGEIYGGGGGRYFEHRCGPGRVLVGLRASVGVLIDNIQAICARVDGAGNFTSATVDGPIFGGNRPQDQHVECPQGFAVASTAVGLNDDHPQVGAIALTCTELANRQNGGSRGIEIRGSGNLEGYDSGFAFVNATPGGPGGFPQCDTGYAVGIRGRAEQYLDAFGLICGAAAAYVDPNAGHTLGKRRKPTLNLHRLPGDSTTTSIPQAGHTLGKRKRPQPTGGAVSESNPMAEQPAQTDQPVGVSLNSDGSVPPPQPVADAMPTQPPSELINGSYLTTLTISDSRCFQDLRSTRQGVVELKPQPGILIPLNQINSVFGAPVVLSVQGLAVSQDTTIPISIGGSVPASFNGGFTADGARFQIRFEAGSPICRIGGTISGVRN